MTTDWIKVLVETEQVPEGWSTVYEISKQLNMTTEATYKRLLRSLTRGEVERDKARINGKLVSIWKPLATPKNKKKAS